MIWLVIILIALPAAGWVYQQIGAARDRRKYPAPGRLVNGLHVWSQGTGPTVVLEAGVAATSMSWQRVQPELAKFARVLSYDRAGLGWSERSIKSRTLQNLIEELHNWLQAEQVPLPGVFVGHSFGGLLLRHYVARYPEDVAGLVLVDPLAPSDWCPMSDLQRYRLSRGVMLSRWGAALARIGVVRFALDLLMSGFRTLPKVIATASSGRAASVTERLVGEVRKLPEHTWPAVKSHWCLPKSFLSMADYLEHIPEACSTPLDDSFLRKRPVTVISAGTAPAEAREEHSQLGQHVVAKQSGHWVLLDDPELVIGEVRRVVGQATVRE